MIHLLTVAVPSSVYSNVSGGNVVTIKVTNSDNVESNTQTITATARPSGGLQHSESDATINDTTFQQ